MFYEVRFTVSDMSQNKGPWSLHEKVPVTSSALAMFEAGRRFEREFDARLLDGEFDWTPRDLLYVSAVTIHLIGEIS